MSVTVDTPQLLLFLLLPLLFIVVALLGFGLFVRTMGARALEFQEVGDDYEVVEESERVRRPWWGNPLLWLGVSAVMVLLGLFVLPQFLGGAFLFLPFFWIGGRTRRYRVVRRGDRLDRGRRD